MIRLTLTLLTVVLTLAFTTAAAWACDTCGCADEANSASAVLPLLVAAAPHEHADGHAHDHASAKQHADHHADHAAPEQDRQAILAMAGEYRVTFQFQETVATRPGYQLQDPYRSGATEFIEVIEDSGDVIRLQHVLVMTDKDGGEPRVVKHWRQDWTYQDTDILAFRGNRTWEHVQLDPKEVRGTWSQAVYQVDDSPRYESFGKWVHVGDRSAWESAETWRPLPRREYTHRDDYQVLVARNRQTITPAGWVHEQDNYKLVLDEQGNPESVIVHESGLNVYDRTDDVDFSAGRLYWKETSAYWEDVREIWDETFEQNSTLTLKHEVDGKRLYASLFSLANDVRDRGHDEASHDAANSTVQAFLVPKK